MEINRSKNEKKNCAMEERRMAVMETGEGGVDEDAKFPPPRPN